MKKLFNITQEERNSSLCGTMDTTGSVATPDVA